MTSTAPSPRPATDPSLPAALGGAPIAVGALTAYTVVCLVHLGAQLRGADGTANLTQWLAVPCLLVALLGLTRLRSRLTRYAAAGLVWSWLGDSLPDFVPESVTFIVLMLAFLVAHMFFIVGFWPWRRESLLHSRIAWLYVAIAVVMVVACAAEAGPLTIGIAVYAGALALMALLARGVDMLAGLGGIAFLISDGLLAVGEFVPRIEVPQSGFWVMLTYLGALALMTLGVAQREARGSGARGRPNPAQ
ncbi:lysoplasmalogenase family protein [Knoellia subterranea]|uniref:YhhN family protein n=1 Tax=Knoellia subterranea KCTC 19937 TaxID=1385521 RepID=A0A0A0JP19_9MICO|nr:lysoplasmalogenase family protein [Knoellia subterranea]KGN39160.1 hypothetical protein N803_01230 [Knoellia subterranea KCTC 19937]